MEKYSFFLFLVVILCVGCSSDEIESMNTDTDYVEYLMNKCDEFADKYKIPLKLNKEKLQCVASQISVEDIECQFAVAAELFKSKTVVYGGLKNKMRIKKKLDISEAQYPFRSDVSYNNTYEFHNSRHCYNKDVTIQTTWAYNEEKLGWIEGFYKVGEEPQNSFGYQNVTFSASGNDYTLRAYTRTKLIWDIVYYLDVDVIVGHNSDGDYISVNAV